MHIRRLSSTTLALLAFILAAAFLTTVAFAAALVIEARTEKVIAAKFSESEIDWVTVHADGLQLILTGTAPNEAARFRAVNMVGSLIDSARVRDNLDVTPASAVKAPDFSVQMLRTEDGIQLIGLMPASPGEGVMTKPALADAAALITPGVELKNFLETANYPAPSTWGPALDFGLASPWSAGTVKNLGRGDAGRGYGHFGQRRREAGARDRTARAGTCRGSRPSGHFGPPPGDHALYAALCR
jgi:OOP family OmpA-OmpF porin